MWFRRITFGQLMFGLLVVFLLIALAKCEQNDELKKYNLPRVVSFHTDGTLFLYSINDDKNHTDVYYSGVDGVLELAFTPIKQHRNSVYVGKNRLYYVEYSHEKKHSKMVTCAKNLLNCETLFEQSGSIQFPIELDDGNLIFQRSPYIDATHRESGYARFQFYMYNAKNTQVEKVSNHKFLPGGPMVLVGNKIYFTAIPKLEKVDSKVVFYPYGWGYFADLSRGDFVPQKSLLKNRRDSNVSTKFEFLFRGKYFAYAAISGNGPYIYQTCILNDYENENEQCKNSGRTTTYPIIVGSRVYYLVLDYPNSKVEIIFEEILN